jgi:hypothetical protein
MRPRLRYCEREKHLECGEVSPLLFLFCFGLRNRHYRIGLLLLFACPALCCGLIGTTLDLRPVDFRPGIGDPEEAKIKIKEGMTKEEVRALLGRPHWPRDGSESGDQWTYRCDFGGGTRFRVYFGRDGRVTHREWWLD